MFLKKVEQGGDRTSNTGTKIERLTAKGVEVPDLLRIFAFKPGMSKVLAELSEEIMRGPSPLSPALRELIAAFTSDRNDCVF